MHRRRLLLGLPETSPWFLLLPRCDPERSLAAVAMALDNGTERRDGVLRCPSSLLEAPWPGFGP